MFRIFSRGVLIGESELEDRDEGMGVARGTLRATAAYADVRSVFRIFADAHPDDGTSSADAGALARYRRLRDELRLTVEDHHGNPVSNEAVHILDFLEEADTIEIEVYAVAEDAWYRGRA